MNQGETVYLVLSASTVMGANKVVAGFCDLEEALVEQRKDRGGRCVVRAKIETQVSVCCQCGREFDRES
jgi:hypothetical protein